MPGKKITSTAFGETGPGSADDPLNAYMAVMDFIYKFAGETDSSEAAIDLLSELEQLDLSFSDLDRDDRFKAHLERALMIAERMGHQLNRDDDIHPLDDSRLLLSLDFRVMAAGSEALKALAPHVRDIGIGKHFELVYPEANDGLLQALIEVRDDGSSPRIVNLTPVDEVPRLQCVVNKTPKREQISVFVLSLREGSALESLTANSLGLTQAETDLVLRLQSGLTLKDAAEQMGIAHNTARNHLKSAFGKLGVNRQADLIRLLTMLSVAVPLRSDREKALRGRPEHEPVQALRNPSLLTLSDGNVIGYTLYGPAVGRPVIVFNTPVSHFVIPQDVVEPLYKRNICLISMMRPGYGPSTPQPNYNLEKYRADMGEFLEVIQRRFSTESFPFLSFVSGARFALEAAAANPGRLSVGGLVSPRILPARSIPQSFGSKLYRQFAESDWALSFVAKVLATRATDGYVSKYFDRWLMDSPVDAQLLEQDVELKKAMILGARIATVESHQAVAQGLGMLFREPSINWDEITMPLIMWHGAKDGMSSLEATKDIHTRLPNSQLEIVEGMGQIVAGHRFIEFLDAVLNLERKHSQA